MDINRAIAIGHELLAIGEAIEQAKVGFSNAHHTEAGCNKYDYYETSVFVRLSAHRERLRKELVGWE